MKTTTRATNTQDQTHHQTKQTKQQNSNTINIHTTQNTIKHKTQHTHTPKHHNNKKQSNKQTTQNNK